MRDSAPAATGRGVSGRWGGTDGAATRRRDPASGEAPARPSAIARCGPPGRSRTKAATETGGLVRKRGSARGRHRAVGQ